MNDGSKPLFPRRPAVWALLALLALAPLAGCECDSRLPVTPVVLPPLSAVVVSPDSITLRVGETARFGATAYDTLNQPVAGAGFGWRSGATEVFSAFSGGRVTAVAEGVDTVFATAGGRTGFAIVSVYQDTGWVIQDSRTSRNLNGVHFLPDGRSGWAVGSSGTIVHTSNAGQQWSVQTSGTGYNLNSVWFTGPGEGWAAGDIGTLLHTVNGGASWTREPLSASDNLKDICFANPDTGWVVGSNGAVYRTTNGGASWQKSTLTPTVLQSVSFANPYEGWVVGDGGVIRGTDDAGVTWGLGANVTTQNLTGVSSRGLVAAWAVGAQGTAPRIEEVAPGSFGWVLRSAGALNQLEGVCFPDDRTGYAVGYNGAGTVLRSDDAGATWQAQVSRASRRLNDVFFVDALRGWAVGDGGQIVHTARGGRR